MDRKKDQMKSIPGPKASHALLSAVLGQVGEAIISIGEDQRITMFNKRAEQLFGYAAEEAIGMPMAELIPTHLRDAHDQHVRQFLASGETSRRMGGRVEIVGLRRRGSEFPAEAAISRVESEGRVVATVLIQDITERRQQVAALRASEARVIRAEKMAAIGTMASGIGHEINNPLYTILGMAEAIRDEEDASQHERYGQDIIAQCKHIAEIVRSLVEYARPAEEHDLELVDMNERLAAAVSMAKRSLLSDHVDIRANLMPVPAILAKPEEIQQALYNVVRNAIQAMMGRGTLEISSQREGGNVLMKIRDTGMGISAEHLQKIYDPFFTTKGPDEGEGLGLYIVRQIVEKYTGTIAFASEKGKGTVCTIQFPVGKSTETRHDDVTQDSGHR